MLGSAAFRVAVAPGGALAGPWVKNSLWTAARAVPSLDLRFAENKSLVDATTGSNLVTFTRASSGTFVGSDGVIRTAVKNLLLRSEEFDNASWTKTRSSVTADAITAPNGTLTGDKLIDSTDASASHFISQSISFVSGTTYTVSIFAKRDEIRYLRLGFNATPFGTTQIVFFDLLNGVISSNPNALAASMTDAGDGWWRLAVTATATSTASDLILVSLSQNGTSISFTGTGTNGLYIWGAQLEQSSTAGEYIPTTSTINSAPRFDHNPTTGESLGLLVEEARTNLLLQSEDFSDAVYTVVAGSITTNTVAAPDGTTTADTVSSTGTTVVSQPYTKAASSITYTASFFAKGTVTGLSLTVDDGATANRGRCVFNLSTGTLTSTSNDGTFTGTSGSITLFANDWYRLVVTTTTNTTTTARHRFFWTGSGTLIRAWGAQLEAGAFPTSYIPTTTATVTRSADVASISGSNFSSWYRQDEGSMFTEAQGTSFVTGAVRRYFEIGDGTANNQILLGYSATNAVRGITNTGGASQTNISATATPANMSKFAFAFAANNAQVAANGLLGTEDTSVTLPTVSTLYIGGEPTLAATTTLNGTIRRLTYWPVRLASTTLEAISQP